MAYLIEERTPTVQEYRTICESVGWGAVINFDVAGEALRKSLYGLVVLSKGEAVGMGRIVGDGEIFFYIQDIAVKPEYQGKGIGRMIMDALMAYLETGAPNKAFVGLFAADGKQPFYERYGFMAHRDMTGMFTVIQQKPESKK
jgi:ribosomal protein S18 acetylase RimI-like enzyme